MRPSDPVISMTGTRTKPSTPSHKTTGQKGNRHNASELRNSTPGCIQQLQLIMISLIQCVFQKGRVERPRKFTRKTQP
ncbi:hypothetical protein J6590_087940 [Homalodisca vitripennis]|nr:hypothetical protein J6590_087940 [Homalodisca vitripennis]